MFNFPVGFHQKLQISQIHYPVCPGLCFLKMSALRQRSWLVILQVLPLMLFTNFLFLSFHLLLLLLFLKLFLLPSISYMLCLGLCHLLFANQRLLFVFVVHLFVCLLSAVCVYVNFPCSGPCARFVRLQLGLKRQPSANHPER